MVVNFAQLAVVTEESAIFVPPATPIARILLSQKNLNQSKVFKSYVCYHVASFERVVCPVITLFGIKNCDTVKKARHWLSHNDIEHGFHDVRADGLTLEQIEEWIAKTDWEIVLNRRGTTWRKLDASIQDNTTENSVAELLLANPAMIKRPILNVNGVITIGFKPDLYHSIFNSNE